METTLARWLSSVIFTAGMSLEALSVLTNTINRQENMKILCKHCTSANDFEHTIAYVIKGLPLLNLSYNNNSNIKLLSYYPYLFHGWVSNICNCIIPRRSLHQVSYTDFFTKNYGRHSMYIYFSKLDR